MHVADLETTEVVAEETRLSLWFWVALVILLFVFFAFFFHHRSAQPPSTQHASSVLPSIGVVQFNSGKSTLTVDGQAALDRAADAMRGNPNVLLRLEGYDAPRTKPKRSGQKDRTRDPLTIQRSRSVEDYLDAKGIDRSHLTSGAFPAASVAQSTALLRPDVESRRAELYVR